MQKIHGLGKEKDEKSTRIIADHLRAATFVLGDERRVAPSNVDQGYVLRRLIRRAVRHGRRLGIDKNFCSEIAAVVISICKEEYPELERNQAFIFDEFDREETRFKATLEKGTKEFERILKEKGSISGKDAFLLFQSYGFPPEMTREMASEHDLSIDFKEFDREFKTHQELSRAASERKFKSGLADFSEDVIKLHTATHLLHAALRKVLGPNVQQKGSNITVERLRFDFSHDRKMADEELKKVEDLVNEQIRKGIPVVKEEMTLAEARKKGAVAFFEEKYDKDKVFVFTVGDLSKEVCSGPHVKNTSELGHFKIQKEEAVSAGVRRIRAVLTKETEPRYISH
jgi:alanyl-tRNA synthetase